jgi:hypothetical protein
VPQKQRDNANGGLIGTSFVHASWRVHGIAVTSKLYLGIGIVIISSAALAYSLEGPTRSIYLPGATSDGHHQIELSCKSCHTKAFADREALQEACVGCHGAELKAANDSHPERKFTDPRNAQRVEVLDARYCVTCHREHRPELTSAMGLSLPRDYCYRCHESIAGERPSHKGLGFDTCADGGCHNFHDNRSLYEDFLLRHLDEPKILPDPRVAARSSGTEGNGASRPSADAPPGHSLSKEEQSAWHSSGHARGGVSCQDCHEKSTPWRDRVPSAVCESCHERERDGYRRGRHGMREATGLEPMRVGDARRRMKAVVSDRTLGCTSCHGAHAFDTRRAAVDACLGCHDDEHSRSYSTSKHAGLWLTDASGRTGASCATCHLPRVVEDGTTHVLHDQNATLRPNEKMARDVCMNCHGLGFTLAALADSTLVGKNFPKEPDLPLRSLEMARQRNASANEQPGFRPSN